MLDLFLVPKHGNAGGRNFPHAGHLGVSPVVVQGKIITKLPSVIPEPFLVRSISLRVKCTEFRAGGAFEGELQNTLYEQTQTILVPPEGDEYISLGDWESPFRIIIPTDAAIQGRSSMTIREYKVVWRMEAVLEHKTIPYVGNGFTKAYALELQNYQAPPLMPLSPPSPLFIGSDTLCSRVSINVPHGAFGPGDSFDVAVQVRPENPAVLVKKVSVVFERFIERVDPKSAGGRRESFNGHSPSKRRHNQSPRAHSPTQTTSKLSSIIRRSLSPRPPFHRLPTDPVAREPESAAEGHVIRDKILETASTGVEQGSDGAGICTLAVNLPRRAGKWALGETHRSSLVVMTYQLKVSATLKGDRRASASKSFTCPPIPIVISSTSSAERSKAAMQAAETQRRKLAGGKNGLYLHEANRSVFDTPEPFHRSEEVLSPITGVATNVKPILLHDKSSPAPSSQSISFIFPSPPPHDSPPKSHLPIHSLLNPESSPPTPDNEQLLSPPPTRGTGAELDRTEFDPEYKSILNRFQAQASSGRRISATTSEEEEVQPLRSRQKLDPEESRGISEFDYPSLPSLDALGLGLPHVPEDARPRLRRPNTAPIHSTFSMSRSDQVPLPLSGGLGKTSSVGGGRPVTSYGVLGRTQRGTGSAVFGRTRTEGGDADTFAFVMPREKSAGSDE